MSYGIDLLFKQIQKSEVLDHIKKVKERFLDIEVINLRNSLKKVYVDYLIDEIKNDEITLKVIENMYHKCIYDLVKHTIEKEKNGNS